MSFANDVSAKPIPQKRAPATATLRYENSFKSGPTNKPEKFITTSKVLIITAAPVVPTPRSFKRSPNNRPKDGSIERVAS